MACNKSGSVIGEVDEHIKPSKNTCITEKSSKVHGLDQIFAALCSRMCHVVVDVVAAAVVAHSNNAASSSSMVLDETTIPFFSWIRFFIALCSRMCHVVGGVVAHSTRDCSSLFLQRRVDHRQRTWRRVRTTCLHKLVHRMPVKLTSILGVCAFHWFYRY